ncbi:lasso peptide biosynthesis PqqD family chaperone [Streptomyces olivaceus]|uniref:lasso peptide biosynthesis PqqD family chaperone n=1 Tax=Streptomyces olivaceus TaxID=47716 RepID=UPI003632E3E8
MNQQRYALRAHVSYVETIDGAVLLNRRTGRYWQLNPTAALVLRTLCEDGTPEQAADTLAQQYPAAADRAHDDVQALLQALHDADALAAP